ncbi:serine/threonine protein kinase [Geodermatophilus pulveris]|uniref:non-specific serine/threonine protein kinase n=1 Tax=Geodermatophilus pulveris TaxID=1564159 RepID=A0A239ISQ2_9ACTN|nr:serine/threonine protein kinase [Geodermatophilus pulveris]SNS96806.1 serine/threonine protein kinase [Geodermatophilus pulveris]
MTTVERGRQTLGDRYDLEELIATGGMGQVWRGRDTMLDRPVAVKVLRSEFADDPTFLARFRAEARHAAGLSHPNIATVLDYGEGTAQDTGENLAYLVMELVDGAPLSALLAEEGPLAPDAALSVLSQAAAGLAEAHRAGVVHRDVKPGNILVRTDGSVKLTDFGIACSAESVPLTGTGQVIGTAQYMSPEQAAGERVSPASDVYALGLVGYETLTGHPAFAGTNPVTVALKRVQEDPDPLPADVPPDVRHLIDAALTKDPQERLPDGDAFLHAIEETVHRTPGTGPHTRPIAPAAAVAAAVPSAAQEAPPAAPTRQQAAGEGGRRRSLLVALAVLAVVLLGAGAVVLLGGQGDDGGSTAAAPPSAEAAPEPGLVLSADDYVGRPVEEVAAELTGLGLTVGRQPEVAPDAAPGTVTALDPAGTEVRPGDRVEVSVATAPAATGEPAPEEAPAADPGPADPADPGSADSRPADPAPAREPAPAEDAAPTAEPAPAEESAAGTSAPAEESAATEDATPTEGSAGEPPSAPTSPSAEATTEATTEPTTEPSGSSAPTTSAGEAESSSAESSADSSAGSSVGSSVGSSAGESAAEESATAGSTPSETGSADPTAPGTAEPTG